MEENLLKERKEMLMALMNDKAYIPMKLKELAILLGVPREDRGELEAVLKALMAEGKIAVSKKGKYARAEIFAETGVFTAHYKGFGFVSVEGRESDLFIAPDNTGDAMDGDTVQVTVEEAGNGRRAEGTVIKVLKRANETVVGMYEKSKKNHFGFVIPDNPRITMDIFVPEGMDMGAVSGHKVMVKLTSYGGKRKNPEGQVVEILGHVNDPGVDILSIVRAYGLPESYPEEVMEEAARVPEELSAETVKEELKKGRKDLRSVPMVTIDGEDAKDLDDAVSISKECEDGRTIYHLGVHIADVAHYVTEKSALDAEAYRRGTSVYLVDRVIPMLPHRLSNGICSLNAGCDRLALSCLMDMDEKGNITGHEICETVVRIDRRMTYTAVNAVLTGGNTDESLETEGFGSMFRLLDEAAGILRKKRMERGAVDFDFAECKILLDEKGRPEALVPRERNAATMLIEDFMLAANETVAQHFYWLEEPFLYRVHDNPDPEKMQQLSVFLGNFGYRLHIGRKQGKRQENGADVHPKQLQKLLDQIEGTPEEAMLSRLILRSMKRAVYSPDCSGHFGLAATHYCHFTSPIRRYPDLQIHRIIKEFLRGRLTEKRKEHYEDILNGVAKHSSETERRADEAERICEKMKKAQYMEKHIGETMEAVISGVTGWGFYAELPNTVEGLVPVSSLRSDYFIFDEENSALVGEHTGKTYQLGETVTVRVTGANRYAGTVDFELEEAEKRGNDGKISTETGREQ